MKTPFLGAMAFALSCFFVAPAHAISAKVIEAIIKVESGGNPKATGRHGEIGLMQLKCATARSVGFKGPCSRLYNPSTNRKYGLAYLRLALKQARCDLDTALSLYQRGVYSRYRGCSSYCERVKRALR